MASPPAIAQSRSTRSSAGSERCPPKAEVTGSNPVGCANDFNNLNDRTTLRKLRFPDYFRIMCSRAVPGRFGNCTAAPQLTVDPLFSPSGIRREAELELIDLALVDDGMKRHWLYSNCNLNLVLFSWSIPPLHCFSRLFQSSRLEFNDIVGL
jgi:hypothetical protein